MVVTINEGPVGKLVPFVARGEELKRPQPIGKLTPVKPQPNLDKLVEIEKDYLNTEDEGLRAAAQADLENKQAEEQMRRDHRQVMLSKLQAGEANRKRAEAEIDEALARDSIQEGDIESEVVASIQAQLAQERKGNQALFWADKYNADKKIPLEKRIRYFEKAQKLSVLPEVSSAIEAAIDTGAFDVELGSRGITKEEAKEHLENISKVETSGGRNNTISSGMAGGILQVIPSTFKDLLKRGVIGKKSLEALGKTKEELLKMSNKEIAEYLRDNDLAGALFGLAAWVNKKERA